MSGAEAALLAVHLAATAAMAGLIWFVQLVHYPLFADVGRDGFVAYEAAHQRRTAWVVGPLMAVEGVSALVVPFVLADRIGVVLPLVGLILLAIIHASTVFLQVPAHRSLSQQYRSSIQERLVRTNWIRTVGWSGRTIVAVAMIVAVA